jgi:uncharacterized protein (TIGR02246 family)
MMPVCGALVRIGSKSSVQVGCIDRAAWGDLADQFICRQSFREKKMARTTRLVFIALMLMSPAVAVAGPAEDANAAVDRWSAAFNSNDPETIAKNYCEDAILLGTVSPVMSEGTQAIIKYFTPTKGTGNKNAIDERRTIAIDDNAVQVTGFYTFTRMVDGKAVPGPSRFTMLVTKRGSEWCIAHHHSSPHVLPKN